jgi:hypothetical protein
MSSVNTQSTVVLDRRVALARSRLLERVGMLESRGQRFLENTRRAITTTTWIALVVTAAGASALLLHTCVRRNEDASRWSRRTPSRLGVVVRITAAAIAGLALGIYRGRGRSGLALPAPRGTKTPE